MICYKYRGKNTGPQSVKLIVYSQVISTGSEAFHRLIAVQIVKKFHGVSEA
jgi:hypothetical protein